MALEQDYQKLLDENIRLKKNLKSKESFIHTILKQKNELNEKISLLFSELEMFKEVKKERLYLRLLKSQAKTIKEIFRMKMKVEENRLKAKN